MTRIVFILLSVCFVVACGDDDLEKIEETQKPTLTLHDSILSGDIEAVRLHIDNDVDLGKPTENGVMPIWNAVLSERYEIAALLVDEGADINKKDENGNTLLHVAVEKSDVEKVRKLLDLSARTDVTNCKGQLPIQVAMGTGNTEIASLLYKGRSLQELVSFTMPDVANTISWIILAFISIAGSVLIVETIGKYQSSDDDKAYLMYRSLYVSIITGLVAIVFLFKQPYLDRIFQDNDIGYWLDALLFGGGLGVGWVVWYLKQLKKYGDFFFVMLLTMMIGLTWYARVTAPEEVQLTTVAFLLGSLFRISTDMMDEYASREKQDVS